MRITASKMKKKNNKNKIDRNKIKLTVLVLLAILILNGVEIYHSFAKASSPTSVNNPYSDPAEKADRESYGSYIEINNKFDGNQPAPR